MDSRYHISQFNQYREPGAISDLANCIERDEDREDVPRPDKESRRQGDTRATCRLCVSFAWALFLYMQLASVYYYTSIPAT